MQRWLVLPGLACPASSFDAVVAALGPSDVGHELRFAEPWATGDAAMLLPEDGTTWGVVGHSLGGLRAIQLALALPGRVSRLVLLDPTPPGEQGPPAWARRPLDRGARALVGAAARLGLLRVAGRLLARRWPAEDASHLGADATWLRWWHDLAAGWDAARAVEAALGPGPAPLPLPAVQLIAGRARRVALRRQQRLARRIGATVVVVPRSGHLIMVDRPDVVAAALTRGGDGSSAARG